MGPHHWNPQRRWRRRKLRIMTPPPLVSCPEKACSFFAEITSRKNNWECSLYCWGEAEAVANDVTPSLRVQHKRRA